jgi:hypothetical protein
MRHKEAKKTVEKVGLIVACGLCPSAKAFGQSGIDLFFVSERSPKGPLFHPFRF